MATAPVALRVLDYDAVGNAKSRVIGGNTEALEYDVEGRVSKVANVDGRVSTYLYDADGQRLITREPSASTLYVFGQEIRLEKNTATPSWTRYYAHNGHVVAMRNSVTGQGKELSSHEKFTVKSGIPVYFCDPRSPWQRGTNENTNGLLRQYFPKGTDLSGYSQAELDAVAAELNDRPRQTLGWKSPRYKLDELLLGAGDASTT